jgi:hypothetical protein
MRRAKKHCSEVIGRQTRDMPANALDGHMLEFCNLTDVSLNLALANANLPALDAGRPWFFAGSDELDGAYHALTSPPWTPAILAGVCWFASCVV